MAAIDKLYANYAEYVLFKEWCHKQPLLTDKYGRQEPISNYLITHWKKEHFNESKRPIFSAPCFVDAYIIRNCPYEFIQTELMLRYGYWTQENVNEMYDTVMKHGGKRGEEGEVWHWVTENDFGVKDGVVKYLANDNSDYMKIKRGELYTIPYDDSKYEIGDHFYCIKHPSHMYNTPFRQKRWIISVDMSDVPMWYHDNSKTWDFANDYVISDNISSSCFLKTIKSIKRHMIKKWKLPVGAKVTVTGRYVSETYEFIITK